MRSSTRSGSKRQLAAGLLSAAFATAGIISSAAAQGDDKAAEASRAAAREAYSRGEQAFDRKDYAAAAEHFRTAHELIPTPHAQYWMAQSLDHLGRVEQAIAAYRALLANPEVDKIGQLKLDTARARLAVLDVPADDQASPSPPAAAPAPLADTPEPEPEPAAAPELDAYAPPDLELTRRKRDRYKPQDDSWELGIFGGPLFVSRAHNLHEERFFRRAYEFPAWLFGARVAYFPSKWVGLEAEYAHGRGEVKKRDGAAFNTLRGQLIGQLPLWRFVPFASLGAGFLEGRSDAQGNDADFLFQVGAGAKVAVTPVISPRLDLRLDMMQRQGGGVSFSKEILLGLSFTLGR